MAHVQLAAAVRDFVTQLGPHLCYEEHLLTLGRALRDVPGTVALGR